MLGPSGDICQSRMTVNLYVETDAQVLQLLLACLWHPVMSLTQIPKFCINTPFPPISTPQERGSCRRCGYKCVQGKVDTPGMQDSNNTPQPRTAMDWSMVGTSSGQSRKMCCHRAEETAWQLRKRSAPPAQGSAEPPGAPVPEDMNTRGPLRAPAQMW